MGCWRRETKEWRPGWSRSPGIWAPILQHLSTRCRHNVVSIFFIFLIFFSLFITRFKLDYIWCRSYYKGGTLLIIIASVIIVYKIIVIILLSLFIYCWLTLIFLSVWLLENPKSVKSRGQADGEAVESSFQACLLSNFGRKRKGKLLLRKL